ncbi:hypothetical protein GQ55_1G232800 [Panicum hallii var. hallii]|uniref:Uncharacterized protein n=1 Tax=Panicum hallii var. hallii TaxID=1504633 RepID=A0A2T7F6Q2_9POAL|nr:hypothetical protein GQ55_1G232800 [Panicum hallii var. hallii]
MGLVVAGLLFLSDSGESVTGSWHRGCRSGLVASELVPFLLISTTSLALYSLALGAVTTPRCRQGKDLSMQSRSARRPTGGARRRRRPWHRRVWRPTSLEEWFLGGVCAQEPSQVEVSRANCDERLSGWAE